MTCGVFLALTSNCGAQEVESLLLKIKAVGKEGAGNVEASKAWKQLVAKGPSVLPDVLEAMDDANPAAANWLRTAVESIQDKALTGGQKISAAKLEAFLKDTKHAGHSRRLAYECLVRLDPATPQRLLPTMLNDPSLEMRRDAVAVKLDHGMKGKFATDDARRDYLKDLLQYARDLDQVDSICTELKKKHNVDIDQTAHYGFVTRWLIAGPFDNTKGAGFSNAYPPELGVDPKATYPGKSGKVSWQDYNCTKALGLVDFNEVAGKLKGAVYYGYAAVSCEAERPVEIRAGSNNAVRIWVNGKEIYFREEYHHGMQVDQHVGKATLKAGRNEILIKVCQNEQTENWAEQWSFQLRVCDALGAAVPVVNVTEKVK
jgi:hypothetical protein